MTSQYPSKKLITITTTMTSIQKCSLTQSQLFQLQYINISFYCRIIVRIQTAKYFNNNNEKQKSVKLQTKQETSRKMIETL